MWYAFTMDSGVANADTKKELINEIQTGFQYRIKRLNKGFYEFQQKEDDDYWYTKYYLCGSENIAMNNGFGDQLKEYIFG